VPATIFFVSLALNTASKQLKNNVNNNYWKLTPATNWKIFYGLYLFYSVPGPIISMYTNTNLNSILTPPNIPIIRSFGSYYRVIMNLVVVVLQVISFYAVRSCGYLVHHTSNFLFDVIDTKKQQQQQQLPGATAMTYDKKGENCSSETNKLKNQNTKEKSQ